MLDERSILLTSERFPDTSMIVENTTENASLIDYTRLTRCGRGIAFPIPHLPRSLPLLAYNHADSSAF